jgi:hypothetical protein
MSPKSQLLPFLAISKHMRVPLPKLEISSNESRPAGLSMLTVDLPLTGFF